MSNEWTNERESSSEVIQICSPSRTIHCKIQDDWVETLYNPTIGANIVSLGFAITDLCDKTLDPTNLSFRDGPQSIKKGQEVVYNVNIQHEDVVLTLDFHIFDDIGFDVLIRHHLETFFYDASNTGELDVKIGRNKFLIPVSPARNSIAEPPCSSMAEEVMSVMPFETPKTSLENDSNFFIEEEDNTREILELPKEEVPSPPLVELKTLPEGLRYAFLHGDKNTPIIVSDKLSNDETSRLIAVLEKLRSVFGYSLQDLKGVSPTLCTHRIPIDPASTPTREPQRRLNNAMREVVKKEVLKLFHAGIIYPVPHSDWVSPVQVVPKKGGMTVVKNAKNEIIPQRTITGWRMCIDYIKLNAAAKKDHFPLPFIDEMLERLAKLFLFPRWVFWLSPNSRPSR